MQIIQTYLKMPYIAMSHLKCSTCIYLYIDELTKTCICINENDKIIIFGYGVICKEYKAMCNFCLLIFKGLKL